MKELKEVLSGKSIRDKKYGEDYDAVKLQKKVGKTQYMIFRDAAIDTIYIVTSDEIIERTTPKIDKQAVVNKIKEEIGFHEEGKKLSSEFLWFRKGDSKRSVLNWINNFLRI